MATNKNVNATEEQARELVEQSREATWKGKGILRNMFLGDFRVDWLDFEHKGLSDEYLAWYVKFEEFMLTKVDPVEIDATGEYPQDVLDGLAKLGAFGIKTPKKYGGLGFSNVEYCNALELVGRIDGNLTALLSAHQSIGIPQPLKLFGTEEQKQKYLTRTAAGAISAFALTEPDVGSDPARLGSTAEQDDNGDWIINGEKLWISNSTIAELLVVMARNPENNKISAFIVECDQPGVEIAYRCRFMGLKALANGVVKFKDVKVPKENIIGKEGEGLKIAFITLNTGRLSIPAATVGSSKQMLEECRRWSTERVQWGVPIGKHEIISHKLADMAATTFGLETLSTLATELSEIEGYDIRLEASAAKEWCTTRNWDIIDEAMQIKGGRGYETEISLAGRGERPAGIERAMRDSRINRIFEGSSEIMHLMMARELVDKHLKEAAIMLDPKAGILDFIKAAPGLLKFYVPWYFNMWFGGLFGGKNYEKYGKQAKHLKYVEASSRRLARAVFHGMAIWQKKMERKQAFMFRAVDIAMELLVMAAVVVRANKLARMGKPEAKDAAALAELFCRNGKAYCDQKFREMWSNEDDFKKGVGSNVLEERYGFMEPQNIYQPEEKSPEGEKKSAAAAK